METFGEPSFMLLPEEQGLSDSLYVHRHFASGESRNTPTKYTAEQVRTMLRVLGILLLELVHGKSFSSTSVHEPNSSNEEFAAQHWVECQDTVDIVSSEDIIEAIRKCVRADFVKLPKVTTDLQHEYDFRFEFLNSVVAVFQWYVALQREFTRGMSDVLEPDYLALENAA
ncbi:hypothetical protein MBLNU457_g2828t1 [Dothideomycetes sp. NU457]